MRVGTTNEGIQRVEVSACHVGGAYQIQAVRVGKGIEFTRHRDVNGWVDAKSARKWAKAVIRMAKEIEREYP